jgi:hypothetical protein
LVKKELKLVEAVLVPLNSSFCEFPNLNSLLHVAFKPLAKFFPFHGFSPFHCSEVCEASEMSGNQSTVLILPSKRTEDFPTARSPTGESEVKLRHGFQCREIATGADCERDRGVGVFQTQSSA